MTTRLVGSPRTSDEQARLDKNQRIRNSIKATKARRKNQKCSTFDLKIVTNKLNAKQREALRRVFLEAKWLWNECIASGDPLTYTPTATVQVKTPDGMETREYLFLGSQMKQAVVKQIKSNIKALAVLRDHGHKTGIVGYTNHVNSLGLPQPGTTYRIKGSKARIQNIPGWVRIRGIRQLDGWELASAKLTHEADGYHLRVTCYMDKEEYRNRRETLGLACKPGTVVGLDMGVATTVTLSNGASYDTTVGETDRLKRLQRQLNRKTKGSNNRRRNKRLIRIEYLHNRHRLDDRAKKVAHVILMNQTVFMQDEQIRNWKRRYGRKLHHSIAGRLKTILTRHDDQVVVLDKWEPTTKLCPICDHKTTIPLNQRTYECSTCGYTAPRDVKAAQSMVWIGQNKYSNQIPLERGEYKPVENATENYAANLRMFSQRSWKRETATASASR